MFLPAVAPGMGAFPPASLPDLASPLAAVDAAYRMLQANPQMAELVRVAAADLAGQELAAVLSAAAAETLVANGCTVFRFEAGGASRWLRQAELAPGLVTLVDVTPEWQMLERAKAEFVNRSELMHDAEIGVWRYDPDAEVYYFSSELALGWDNATDPTPLERLQRIQHPEDRAKDREIRTRLTTEGGEARGEMRYRTENAAWIHLDVLYRANRRLPSGRYEMYGLSQNVTRLAEARDVADANAQRLRLALKAATSGVFGLDYRTNTYWASPEFEELVGAAALARTRDDPRSIFHPDDRPAVREIASRERDHGDPIDVRLLAEGPPRWVRLYWEIERDPAGKPVRGVGLLLDIHEAKQQELALIEARRAAEAATESKSNFLASVSHEIRTPMNGIVGVLNLLKRELLSDEGSDLLHEAVGCSAMLTQLIDDVLDFSKIEAGKLEVSPAPTDPVSLLHSVCALLSPQVEAKGLYLRCTAAPLGWVDVDPVRLRQCLFNVIGNAVKFTAKGGVEVRMRLVEDESGRRLRCEIEDTGVGIPLAAQATLFDRFQQAESGTTRKYGGTGLGLAITRSLARLMGGDMGFASTQGQGSTFWFEIDAPPAQGQHAPAPEEDGGALLHGLRILVVDDNHVNRIVGVKSVEALGAQAVAAESGEAAIALARTETYDLILMDINMPGMDGLETTRRIRALGGAWTDTPIVALTADVMTHHRKTYADAGLQGFVPKPFSPRDLLDEIMRLAG